MKKTVNVAIGSCSFIINEDAYYELETYLERFRGALGSGSSDDSVMEELEGRIADLFKGKLGGREVVDLNMVNEIIDQIGYPQGYKPSDENIRQNQSNYGTPVKKLFRDTDDKKIAGVCSGLSLYFGSDVVAIRVIFLIAFIFGLTGFWVYLVIWIVAPEAKTAVEKCELRGIPATAENIRRFTNR